MSLRKKAAKGVAWTTIDNLGTQAIYFVLFLLLARLLGPEAFGLVSLAGVFVGLMMVFADQGLSDAIIQRQDLQPEHLNTAFWTNLGIGILLTLITVAAAEPVSIFFKEPQLAPIIRWLSLSFLCSGFSGVQHALLRRQLAFKALALRSLISIIFGGVVGVTMACMGYGVWSLVGQQLVNRLVAVLTLWWASHWRPGLQVSAKHFQDLFSFGINMLGSSILVFFSIRSDDFLIGYFLGPVQLGYYSVAYRLLVAMTQILNTSIRQVALPLFSKLQQEPEQLRQAFLNATQLVSFISFPAFVGTATMAPELVQTLFGQQWTPSIPLMQILALSGITSSVFTLNGPLIIAMGKPSWNFWITLMNTVTNVIGFIVAVPWGIVVVAASFTIRSFLVSPFQLLAIRKLLQIKLTAYFSQFFSPFIGTVMMSVGILGAKHFLYDLINLQALLAACIALGIGVYVATMLLIAPKLAKQVIDFIRLSLVRSKQKQT